MKMDEVLDDETRPIAEALADMVAERLRPMLEIASLPAYFGLMLRDAAKHGNQYWSYWVPLNGPDGINVQFMVAPGGALTIRLHGSNMERVWEHTLRPVQEAA